MAAYSKEQLEKAAEQLQAAIAASPTLAEAYAGLGLVREAQGQADAAAVAYRQALHLEPDNFNAKTGLARLRQLEPAAPGTEPQADQPEGDPHGGSEGVTP